VPVLKTANLAIVFTDIKGFTERTSRQTLEENQRLLKTHHDLLVPLFKAFGGRIIKSIGDAFLVTFESPTQAVLSGMAVQDRLWQYNRGVQDAERLEVRVAINAGEVRVESNDVFGEPVNIASRVEGLAEAGEVFFTEAVYLIMNKAEVPSQEVGLFELKGIPGKIRVYRVPSAPYRVEKPAVVHLLPGAETPIPEQPPFGNLALSRVPESALLPGSDFAATAAQVGERLARGTRTVFAAVKRPTEGLSAVKRPARLALSPKVLAVGVGVLVLLGGGVFLLSDSPTESAIEAVAKAPPGERNKRVREARRLINEEKRAPGERSLLLGQLEEAQETPLGAVAQYSAAVKAGNENGGERLKALLENKECRVRIAAAQALGELKWAPAKGALERLAKNGGPGEDDRLFIGCDSRKAAASALERLGR
jgi:adenylate cyclase